MIYVAPRLIGEGLSGIGELGIERIDDSIGLTQVTTRRLGEDLLVTGKVESCSPV
jgi:riboflavin biosynthesis pyrimidine reductase